MERQNNQGYRLTLGEEEAANGSNSIEEQESYIRWVFQDNNEDGHEDDLRFRNGMESDDDTAEADHRLIRTGPKLDSLDVETLEVSGAQRNDFEDVTFSKSIKLAFQTLGVVFGDVGTSPLYTFSVMFSKAPIEGNEDIIGALSLVIYTLILIPLVKYVLVVLWANDDGEGGTFALYSLICRHAKVSLLPNQVASDTRISNFKLKVPSAELERSLRIKERLEASLRLKKLLLMLVLVGTSMVIADGVVTPAMSGFVLLLSIISLSLGDTLIQKPANRIKAILFLARNLFNSQLMQTFSAGAVMSAVRGLKVGVPMVEEDHVVMISVAYLIVLFSVQKIGTSKIGLALGPALFIWFCSLGGIGIYNLVKHDSSVLKAFNPIHIYYYFKRDSAKALYSLGGCLLCATGSEAMFADLCYFSVGAIQLIFTFLVLPCLLLGYLGQAAYLMDNSGDAEQPFFSSIPYADAIFWPVFLIANIAALIASRTMTTATFSCVKQSIELGCFPRLKIIHTSRKFMGQIYIPVVNWFLLAAALLLVCFIASTNEIGNAYGVAEVGVMMMSTTLVILVMLLIWQINIILVLSFSVLFLGLELVFFSSVLWGIRDGSWLILVFAVIVYFIMYIWNYGSKLKYETEVTEKMSMDLMRQLGSNLGTVRAPGIGLLYNELANGVPTIFEQFLATLPAVHSMIVFVCIKYVPVPFVPPSERFLFRRVCPKSYHLFRCIARYGYKDVHRENHQIFEQLLIESLEKFIRREAKERSLESDVDADTESEDESSHLLIDPNGTVYSLGAPLLSKHKNKTSKQPIISEASTSHEPEKEPRNSNSSQDKSLENELEVLRVAKESGVVYLLGHVSIRARKDSWFIKKLAINYFYAFLRKNCRRGIATLSVPHTRLMEVAITYMV